MCKLEDSAHVCATCAQAHICKHKSSVCLYTWMCLCGPAHTNLCPALPGKWSPGRVYPPGRLLAGKPGNLALYPCASCEVGQALASPVSLDLHRQLTKTKRRTATEKSLAHSDCSLPQGGKCALGTAPSLETEPRTPEVCLHAPSLSLPLFSSLKQSPSVPLAAQVLFSAVHPPNSGHSRGYARRDELTATWHASLTFRSHPPSYDSILSPIPHP